MKQKLEDYEKDELKTEKIRSEEIAKLKFQNIELKTKFEDSESALQDSNN